MSDPILTDDQFFAISRSLERHHAVFYRLWELGKPVWDDQIPTAQVEFNHEGATIAFVFNPKFWERLSEYEREFVIAHECIHTILNHGMRCKDTKTGSLSNYALDIVVNHLLVERFGYERDKLSMAKELCWVDTLFAGKKLLPHGGHFELVDESTKDALDIPTGQTFEFYFLLIRQEAEKNPLFVKLMDTLDLLDGHEGLSAEGVDEIIRSLNESLSPQEKETLKDVLKQHYSTDGKSPRNTPAGDGIGNWTFASVGKVQRKRKWETIIKKWSRKFWRPDYRDMEQWARINRRFALVNGSLLLPSEMEVEHEREKGKIDVWFFQDTSGSCWDLRDRFFKAALTLPTHRFKVRVFCFDTEVKETSLASRRIYGGGGTSFSALEKFIQATIQREGGKYPQAVFVITDGYGDYVNPQKPENWYWFLTSSCTHYLPKTSHSYDLRDFE
jgi:hypothetical protein